MAPWTLPLITSLLLMKCLVTSSADAKVNTASDESTLLAFRAQITSDPHNILAKNWSIAASFCNWIGVTCSSRPRRIAALNLGNMQLVGSIPPQVANLSLLVSLNLSNNNFHGQIPQELTILHRLEYLNLGHNMFTGEIPSRFALLTFLQVLDLQGNEFTGSIPKGIGSLDKLKEVYLGGNYLTGTIPQEMGDLQKLQVLDLSFNNITGPIPPPLFNLSMLRSVNLGYNLLSGQLPSGTGLWLRHLQLLNLQHNELSGPIPDSLGNASTLRTLDISDNSFSGLIPDSFGNLRNLKKLNLAENFLTSKSSSAGLSFLSSLANCGQLAFLRVNGNPLGGRLPISVGNMSSLQELYAYECNIEGNVPGEIGNLTNLIGLILQNNELTGTIPREIGRLRRLQDFSLASNKFHGQIPFEMCNLESLMYLFLLQNGFSGALPACLSNVTSLRELYMSYNRFSGIPSSFWTLKDLLLINFSFNALSGSLPLEIGNLKVVTKIDLSSNRLSGDLPTTIGDLQNLAHLLLSDNRLQGPIPQSFGELISLESLDLSGNYLSGFIPKSLEKLLHLESFNVSSNRLQGEIPTEGPFANFYFQSFMDNQGLCGPARMKVPPCKSSIQRQSNKITNRLLILYITPPVASILLILVVILVFTRRRKRNLKISNGENLRPLRTWRRVSYHELENATEGFSEVNLLGRGSFGTVYRGKLSDGTCIAVKVFNLQLEGAFARFDAECDMLRNLRHRNLVKVISSCCNPDFKALILEFMPFQSLEKWLYSHNYFLDTLQRLNVMVDVASALEYLHYGYGTPVVHCDLKPSNVLLNEDMIARVADFGISKLLGEGDPMTQTMTLATIGYMAPEYGLQGIVSARGDVYSYGILLMETFTRKKPTDEMFCGEMSMKQWVTQSLPHAITEVADANLLRREEDHFAAKEDCIASILKLALMCTSELPEDRLCIKEVIAALEKIVSTFNRDIAVCDNKV